MRYPEHPSPQAMTAEINRLGHLTLREEGLSFYVQSADSIGKIRDGSMTTETTRDLDAGLVVQLPESVADDFRHLNGWAL